MARRQAAPPRASRTTPARPRQIETGEEIEVSSQPEAVRDGRGDQPADKVARDIAGDIGGEGSGLPRSAVRSPSHASVSVKAVDMHSPCITRRMRKDLQIGRQRQQRGRHRQQHQTDHDTVPPVDPLAEQRGREPRHRHPKRAGIDRHPHGRRRDAIGDGQHRQNRLRREQIHDGEEGQQRHDGGAWGRNGFDPFEWSGNGHR